MKYFIAINEYSKHFPRVFTSFDDMEKFIDLFWANEKKFGKISFFVVEINDSDLSE